jgi:adenosylcobinamide-phosphate synthase
MLMFLVERYVPWADKYHPISLATMSAHNMAKKVLAPHMQSIRQQLISGGLAVLVLLFPVIVIIAVFIYLSEYPIFFEALMLLVALRFQNIIHQTNKITAYLQSDKKILARQTVSSLCLRETVNMSPLGLIKANVESLLLRYSYGFCSVLFWYVVLGGAGAVIYRILYEISLAWNNKLNRFQHFGKPVRYIVNILNWIPVKLAGLSFMLTVNITQGVSAILNPLSYKSDHLYVLNVCGSSLGIELGGPAYYDQQKVRTTKCGGSRLIVLADNLRTLSAINRAKWLWLTLYFLGSALWYLQAN